MSSPLRDDLLASLGVICPVSADAGHGFIRRYLSKQVGQHGRVAHAVVSHFNGPYFQGLRINAQMHLAPLSSTFTAVLGTLLFAHPFTLAQEFDTSAVHQQVQSRGARSVGQLDLARLLTTAQRAVVRHRSLQSRQTKQALNKTQCLAQRQTQQAFDAQAELDGCIRKCLPAASFTRGSGKPLHLFVRIHWTTARNFLDATHLAASIVWLA